jgi:hypothetical protein
MYLVTFFAILAFTLVAAFIFGGGLVRLYQKHDRQARGLISTGFMIGLIGVVIAVIIFNVFNL